MGYLPYQLVSRILSINSSSLSLSGPPCPTTVALQRVRTETACCGNRFSRRPTDQGAFRIGDLGQNQENHPNWLGKKVTLEGTITYPTLGSWENHRLKMPFFGGYVSFLEGNPLVVPNNPRTAGMCFPFFHRKYTSFSMGPWSSQLC